MPDAVQRRNAGRLLSSCAGAAQKQTKYKVRECGPQPDQYHPAERALLKKREAIFEQRFRARSRCEGRRQRMVIADAVMQRRELPAAAGKNLESGAKRLWSASPWGLLLGAKRLWSASPWGLLLDAKRLWSAEIHLRFQLAHDSYTAMCVNRGHDRLESGAEVGFAAPPGSALQGGRAIFWCDAGE